LFSLATRPGRTSAPPSSQMERRRIGSTSPIFGVHRLDWSAIEAGGGIEFCLTIGDWIRLFDDTGFDVVDYREVRAPDSASKDEFGVDVEWAKRFPAEHAWRLRKRT
jgi:hypothetical protein